MLLRPGVVRVARLVVEAVGRQASRAGHTVFVLPAEGVDGREPFFCAVRAALPLDPPLAGSGSWDAMSDSLWQGLHALPCSHIAILWPNASSMAAMAPADFDLALCVLGDVADQLADPRVCGAHHRVKRLSVVVESAPVTGYA